MARRSGAALLLGFATMWLMLRCHPLGQRSAGEELPVIEMRVDGDDGQAPLRRGWGGHDGGRGRRGGGGPPGCAYTRGLGTPANPRTLIITFRTRAKLFCITFQITSKLSPVRGVNPASAVSRRGP